MQKTSCLLVPIRDSYVFGMDLLYTKEIEPKNSLKKTN
jgi:hypothetical protein